MKKQSVIIRDEETRKRVIQILSSVGLDKPVKVEWGTYSKARSLNQNALMWKWINEVADIIADDTGYTPNEMHEYFKHEFLTPRVIDVNGTVIEIYSTTKLTTQEMSEYMGKIQAWAAQQGYYLPSPEDMQRYL